uniref:Uncharacterized protein n=1 Tax=Myoviridae sp. ctjz83 TaxID=2826083 RepID=A0A8D9PDW6_9CAUD|nr:MAG TPA: hypothetical protein [Myoviridae sp. ctjz83]
MRQLILLDYLFCQQSCKYIFRLPHFQNNQQTSHPEVRTAS